MKDKIIIFILILIFLFIIPVVGAEDLGASYIQKLINNGKSE